MNHQERENLHKTPYRYIPKYQVKFDDWKLKEQKVKRRNVIRWTCHEYRNVYARVIFLKRHLQAIRAAKGIQILTMERFGSYTLKGKEFELLREGLKKQRSLKTFDFNFISNGNNSDRHLKGYVQSLKKLPSLRNIHLQFYSSEVTDKGLQRLIQALKGLCFMQKIDLFFEKAPRITDSGLLELSNALKGLKTMEYLKLSFGSDEITEKGLRALGESLKELRSLRQIDFNFSWFRSRSLRELIQTLNELRLPLENITLSFANEICTSGQRITELGQDLKELGSLQTHTSIESLMFSNINHQELELLSQSMKKLDFLRSLHLTFLDTSKVKEGIRMFSETFKRFLILKNLYLRFDVCSEISNNEILFLSQGLQGLFSLRHLTLAFGECGEEFSDPCLRMLGQALKELRSLETFSLNIYQSEKFTNEGLEALKEGLEDLKALKKIDFGFTAFSKFDDEGFCQLSQGLGGLSSLKEIAFRFERCDGISSKILKEVTRNLKAVPSLQSIDFALYGCMQVYESEVFDLLDSVKGVLCTVTHGENSYECYTFDNQEF